MALKRNSPRSWTLYFLGNALLMACLYLTSLYSYLFFHSLTEIISVIVSVGIFIFVWNSQKLLQNGYFLIIGVAFLFIGGMDLLHALAYQGMGVFEGYGTNLSSQLWIAARFMQASSFLIALIFIPRRPRQPLVWGVYLLAAAVILLSIFYWQIFPVCYVEGQGQTVFQKIAEYVICLVLLAAVVLMERRKKQFEASVLRLIQVSLVFSVFSEIASTFFIDPFSTLNMVGHLLKILSFFLIYTVVLDNGFRRPFSLLTENIRRDQERFRLISENIRDVIWIYNTQENKFVYVSPSVNKLLGYSPEDIINTPVQSYIKPDSLQMLYAQFAGYISSFQDGNQERCVENIPITHIHKDGRIIDTEALISILPGSIGKGVEILGVSRDMTERKHIEHELRASEKKYRELVENLQEGLWLLDADRNTRFVNSSLARMLSSSPEEVQGKNLYQYLDDTGKRIVAEKWEQIARGVTEKFELELISLDGSRLFVRINAVPVTDESGLVTGCMAMVEDITDIREVEGALEESEARYRTVTENMQGGVILFEKGKVLLTNRSASTITGYSQEEFLSMSASEFLVPEEKDLMLKFMQDNRDTPVDISCWIVRKNGERRFIQARYSRIQESEQKPLSFVIINDITDLKTAQIQLQALYEQEKQLRHSLEKEISKRIEFTHALVHELKTPLTPVLTSSEMLMRILKEGVPMRLAKNIFQGAVDLEKRTDELLQLARMEVGSFKLDLQPVDPLQIIREMVENVQPVVTKNRQFLRTDLPASLPEIEADSDRLRQVILNLINNAVKYTPEGTEIVISARKEDNIL